MAPGHVPQNTRHRWSVLRRGETRFTTCYTWSSKSLAKVYWTSRPPFLDDEVPIVEDQNYYAAPRAPLGPRHDRDPSALASGPRDFGETFSAIIDLYIKAFVPILLIALTWATVNGIGNYVAETQMTLAFSGQGGSWLLVFLGYLVLFFGGIYFWILGLMRVDKVYRGESGSTDEIGRAFVKLLPVVGFYFLMGMVVGAGTLFCLIPGLILAILLFVGDVSMVLENRGPIAGMQRSWELVKGVENWFFCLAVLMVVGLMIAVPSAVIGGAAGLFSMNNPVVTNLVTAVLTVVTFPLGVVLNYIMFKALLARNSHAMVTAAPVSYDPPAAQADGQVW